MRASSSVSIGVCILYKTLTSSLRYYSIIPGGMEKAERASSCPYPGMKAKSTRWDYLTRLTVSECLFLGIMYHSGLKQRVAWWGGRSCATSTH